MITTAQRCAGRKGWATFVDLQVEIREHDIRSTYSYLEEIRIQMSEARTADASRVAAPPERSLGSRP